MKHKSRLERARAVRDEITRLADEQEKLYAKAIKDLKLPDNWLAHDFFYSANGGYSLFEEELQ